MNINPLDKKFDHLRGLNNDERAAKVTELKAYIEPFTTRDEGINAEESERLATALEELELLGYLKEQRNRLLSLASDSGRMEEPNNVNRARKDSDPTRDAALSNIERSHKAGRLSDAAATLSEALVGTDSTVARLAAVTGSEAYRSAFAKMVSDPTHGHLTWDGAEAQSYRDAEQVRGLIEGAAGTGKALLPFDLDPSIILTSAGSVSPLREISRVVQTTSNAWNGVSSAGVVSEWTAETAQAPDGTPTLAPEPIPVHKASSWIPFSIELEQDGLQLLPQLQALLADSALQLENAAFITGSGNGQPTGLVTALVAAGGSVIVPAAGESLTSADVYKLQGALGSRWQSNARFAGNLSILNLIRQMETTNGALKFPGAQDVPATLLNRPLHEVSGMDGDFNPAVTAANYVLAYGDFSNFVIVDRIGTTVELVPHLMGVNGRPTGERGLYMYRRVGSNVVNPAAFKLLNIATTA